MANGKTHDRVTLWTFPWVVILSWFSTRDGEITLIVSLAFLFSGLMFGPDLDIYSIQYQRWGKLRVIWNPYQKWCKHRSFWSHGLLIGTSVRIIYLLTLGTLLSMFIISIGQLIWGFEWNWQQAAQKLVTQMQGDYREETLALYLGLELGAISHISADWWSSWRRRHQSARGRKKRAPRQSFRKKSR